MCTFDPFGSDLCCAKTMGRVMQTRHPRAAQKRAMECVWISKESASVEIWVRAAQRLDVFPIQRHIAAQWDFAWESKRKIHTNERSLVLGKLRNPGCYVCSRPFSIHASARHQLRRFAARVCERNLD